MKHKALLGVGVVALVIACTFLAYRFGRSSAVSVVETPPAPPPKPQAESAIDIEPALVAGSRVEALSAEGWMPATIQETQGTEALIRYERAALGEERVDVRLLRKPESELVAKAAPAMTRTDPVLAAPPPPTLGPRASASSVPVGTYDCALDTKGIVKNDTGTFADDEAQQWELSLTLDILSDRDYGAFGQDAARFAYDAATGRITWEGGVLAGQPAQYKADTNTIVSSMGGQALTCALRR